MSALSDPVAAVVSFVTVAPVVSVVFLLLDRFSPSDDDVPGQHPVSHQIYD